MITIQQIEKEYGKRIPRKFRVHLEKYIDKGEVQSYLKKALAYELSDADYRNVYDIGYHPDSKVMAKYPGLNYICVTFIHPITKWMVLADKVDRLNRELDRAGDFACVEWKANIIKYAIIGTVLKDTLTNDVLILKSLGKKQARLYNTTERREYIISSVQYEHECISGVLIPIG